MAEDIITDLSKLSGLLVTSRNSSFAYRGDNIDIGKVGRELGVRFVLEGSVRRAGDQVRINAQLIDVASGAHLWAERYTGSLQDVFALQDQVSRKIIDALTVKLNPAEELALAKKDTDNAEAYELVFRGIRHLNAVDPLHHEENIRARESFQKAIELDSNFARAVAGLAWTYWYEFTTFSLVGSDKDRALTLAIKLIELNDNALAHRLIAQSLSQTRSVAGGGSRQA
jgi:adenylate cyclase